MQLGQCSEVMESNMNNSQRMCIGFDLRIEKNSLSHEIKALFLNNTLIFSADPNVLIRLPEIQLLLDENLWNISNPLNLFLNEQKMEDTSSEIVGITSLLRLCLTCSSLSVRVLSDLFGSSWLEMLPTENQLISQGWKLRGFDTIDLRGLFSGLSGCGNNRIISDIQPLLNDCNLFSKEKDAIEFAEARGLQIPIHAPFIVVGVLTK